MVISFETKMVIKFATKMVIILEIKTRQQKSQTKIADQIWPKDDYVKPK